jgi:hypothetical protein
MTMGKENRSKSARARYWRKRVMEEGKMNRTELLECKTVSATMWRVKRQTTIGGKVCPVGAHVADGELGQNRDALISSGAVVPAADSAVAVAQSRELPVTSPPIARPPAQFVHGEGMPDDEKWDVAFAANLRVYDNDAAITEDEMLKTPYGKDLYKRAVALRAARIAEQRRAGATQHLQSRLEQRGVR